MTDEIESDIVKGVLIGLLLCAIIVFFVGLFIYFEGKDKRNDLNEFCIEQGFDKYSNYKLGYQKYVECYKESNKTKEIFRIAYKSDCIEYDKWGVCIEIEDWYVEYGSRYRSIILE